METTMIPKVCIVDENSNPLPVEGEEAEVPVVLSKKLIALFARIKWSNVVILVALHAAAIVAFVHVMLWPVKFYTLVFSSVIGLLSGLGMAIGAHRLWAHRSFKATLALRIILAIFQAMTMNGSAFSYARDHRTHHKYSDTERDPKNPSRGLFYSHVGWWMVRKTDQVKRAGEKLDFSDLRNDPVVWLQHRFYTPLFLVLGVLLPTLIPHLAWGEDLLTSFYLCAVLRIVVVLHHLFTVNSVAHFFGHRPYDFRIRPTENRLVIYLSLGEGNHNYHHTFPYDYSSSEKAAWEFFNPSTAMIDLCHRLGMAYQCKKASMAAIRGMIQRRGNADGGAAIFDPPRSVCFRLLNGLFDWILGLAVAVWPMYPILLFKYFTGREIFVF